MCVIISGKASEEELTPFDVQIKELHIYEKEFTTLLQAGQYESCFFIEMTTEHQFVVDFSVLSSNSNNGQFYEISFVVKNPHNRILFYQPRASQSDMNMQGVAVNGSHQFCFQNIYSATVEKQVSWGLTVHNMEDNDIGVTGRPTENDPLLDSQEEMLKWANNMKINMIQAKARMWYMVVTRKKASFRILAIKDMIDTWSMFHAFLVIGVGGVQTFFLRRLFSDPTMSAQRMKVRT